MIPRWLIYVVLVLVVASWIPLVLIARARSSHSRQPRIHLIQDMDNMPSFQPQQANVLFTDGRAMRPDVTGTVARGQARLDDHYYTGKVDGEWAESFPDRIPLTDESMQRGKKMYDILCSTCHGLDGRGQGLISIRADELAEGTWVPPSSMHTDPAAARPVGHLFNTITNGIRNMAAYGPETLVEDRWKIIMYIRALQRSQNTGIDDVPAEKMDVFVPTR